MIHCLFTSDLHGRVDRYDKLVQAITSRRPDVVFLGGDLLPHFGFAGSGGDFILDVVGTGLESAREALGSAFPTILTILGNDDPGPAEASVEELERRGLWHYVHNRSFPIGKFSVFGYNIVPPTPFLGKDWEKYDVSAYVPPGAVSPEEGFRSVAVRPNEIRYSTIARDLDMLLGDENAHLSVLLFHSPPSDTFLDRIDTAGKMIDHVPLDEHVGSIAIRRLIETKKPHLSLHGHIHESARLTGHWKDQIDATLMFSAAHDGPELSLISFDLEQPEFAERELI